MARGDNNDSKDSDGRPGNEFESADYDRVYDPRGLQEISNLPETTGRLAELRDEEQQANARIDAQSRVFFKYDFGKFIVPRENTWAAHAEIVCNDRTQLSFSPEHYPVFDRIIAERSGFRPLFDPKHRDYAKYEAMRTNLEVLRNDIIGSYMHDGSFDPGDERYIPHITAIAAAIGDALRHDSVFGRFFGPSISKDVANVEGVGAAEIYTFLLEKQIKPAGPLDPLIANLRSLFGLPNRNWGLPPLKDTPFSPEGLSTPPPGRHHAHAAPSPAQEHAVEDMAALGHEMLSTAHKLRSPESLAIPTKKESVDEARTILRWLKNLQGTSQPMEQWMQMGSPNEQHAKANALAKLVAIYGGFLSKAKASNVSLNRYVQDSASDAAGSLAQSVAAHAYEILPDGDPRITSLDKALENLPPEWQRRQNQSVERLVESIESGMAQLTKKPVSDRSPIDRLVEIGERIKHTARNLRSVDTLKEPARAESVELAREILRRLRNLSFSDKTMEDAIDTGKPDEKLAFAQKIGELVELYKDLLARAARKDPRIFSDPRIKEANNVVGCFSHMIKLLAAKEMPNSIASAQQISADISQMPDEWKQLCDRTVDRLLHSMEGGLECAVQDMAIEQQELQDQQDEQTETKTEEQLLATALHSHGRKRRRRRHSGAGGPARAAARVNANDKDGDGVRDILQGKGGAFNAIDRQVINQINLAEVARIGQSLDKLNKQAASLTPIAPEKAVDDKSFTDKSRDPNGRGTRPRVG